MTKLNWLRRSAELKDPIGFEIKPEEKKILEHEKNECYFGQMDPMARELINECACKGIKNENRS